MDFRADFVEDKAKFRRLAVASQEILTHEVFGHLPKVGARTRRQQSKWRNAVIGKIWRKDACQFLCGQVLNPPIIRHKEITRTNDDLRSVINLPIEAICHTTKIMLYKLIFWIY